MYTHKFVRLACLCVSVLANMLNIDPNQDNYKHYQERMDSGENRIEKRSDFIFF